MHRIRVSWIDLRRSGDVVDGKVANTLGATRQLERVDVGRQYERRPRDCIWRRETGHRVEELREFRAIDFVDAHQRHQRLHLHEARAECELQTIGEVARRRRERHRAADVDRRRRRLHDNKCNDNAAQRDGDEHAHRRYAVLL